MAEFLWIFWSFSLLGWVLERLFGAELTSLLRCRRSAAPQSASSPSPLAALPAQVPGQRGAPCCEAPA